MSTDILESERILQEKEERYHGSVEHLGVTLMAHPQYTSAVRLTMFANHLKQFTALKNGEPPFVFTHYENIFGRLSSGLVTSDHDYEIVAKIDKFSHKPNYLYTLFMYDEEHDYYSCVTKKISENLTEKFGYMYNNESLDALEVGDTISKGDVLYKSSSYDEDNNYCYGVNANVAYILDPSNVEDAYGIRQGFAEKMINRNVDTVKIMINDNDVLLNLYGDAKHYRPFPDLGDNVKSNILCSKRRIINDQMLFDLKKSNLMKIIPNSDTLYKTKGFVADINIYSNMPLDKIPECDYNEEIIKLIKNQYRYAQELHDICETIINSGSEYCDDIGFIYSRTSEILNPDYKWKDQENVFSNVIIEIQVDRDIALSTGSKITGRNGDKGVISEIRPDEEMPFTADGRVVDVIINPLSCPNRLNPFQWIELSITHSARILIERMKKMKTNEERYDTLVRFLKYFNEKGEQEELIKYYNGLSKLEQDEFWENIYENGIYINYPPMWEGMPALDKIHAIKEEFGIERDQLYIRKFGRVIPIMRKVLLGNKYMMKLKQTSEKNFSARSIGSLSQQGVPEKSNKVRTNEKLYSSTPIALGRDENNNLAIGVDSFMLAKLHLFYRTSPFARREISKLYTHKNILNYKKFKIKPGFRNRNVETLNAKLMSLGIKIDFGFSGLTIDTEDDKIRSFTWKDELYICTRKEMREIILDYTLRYNFNLEKHKGTPKEIEAKYQKYKAKQIAKINGELLIDCDPGYLD